MEQLQPGVAVFEATAGRSYVRFWFEVLDTSQVLTVRAKPADDESDPDLYLICGDPEVSQERYAWKANNVGSVKVEVLPEDPEYVPGIYYVAVYAYSPVPNSFYISHEYNPATPIVTLGPLYEGVLDDWLFFKFDLEHPGNSRLKLEAEGGVALFLSSHVYYPTVEEHSYSAGYYDSERIVLTHSESFSRAYIDIDPFDQYMPRDFCYKPANANCAVKTEPQEPVTLCLETEEWKTPAKTVYVAVKNMRPTPSHIRIRKTEAYELDLVPEEDLELVSYFQSLFSFLPGSSVSQAERKRLELELNSEFTYGEVELLHFKKLLEVFTPKPAQVFWDLGCGAGKCLVAVALLYPSLKAVKGVEFLPALSRLCETNFSKVDRSHAPLSVITGDILEVDWSDADMIFTSSICFPEPLFQGLFEKARLLKPGSLIITLRSFPPNTLFLLKMNLNVRMSWGKTGGYVFEKL